MDTLFELSGVVKKQSGKAWTMGIPTANIDVDTTTPEGIFVGYTILSVIRRPSIIFIGAPITFGEKEKRAETHIFDFDDSLYGEFIKIQVLKKLRDNKKFPSEDKLMDAMAEDIREARKYFEKPQGYKS